MRKNLVACPACGLRMAVEARACPHCGQPNDPAEAAERLVRQRRADDQNAATIWKVFWWSLAAIAVAFLLFVGLMFAAAYSSRPPDMAAEMERARAAERGEVPAEAPVKH